MNKKEIYETIKSLAQSQGYYCRLLAAIKKDDRILSELEKQKFADAVDLVMFCEC